MMNQINPNDLNIIGIGESVEVRDKIYSIQEVYDAVKDHMFDSSTKIKTGRNNYKYKTCNRSRVEIDGEMVTANSQRLQLFYTKGFRCVKCGTEGKFFIMVKHRTKKGKLDPHYHLELIGVTPNGEYVLMTKDHILPKSKGGKDELDNYQTMCVLCNGEKADNSEEYMSDDIDTLKAANKELFAENARLRKRIEELEQKYERTRV